MARGYRDLFLDMCGPGRSGPDFRRGAAQLGWLERELVESGSRGETAVVFMHTYREDLRQGDEGAALARLFAENAVALAGMSGQR